MNRQLKLGLGIGCGSLVVAFLIIAGSITFWATNTGRDFKTVIKAEKELNKEYGVLGAYVPPDHGLPSQERIATFLKVRQSMVEYHAGMGMALEEYITLKEANSGGGFVNTIKAVRAGSQLGPAYALFWLARNEKLMENGMGAGEYAYIYCLAYYGFLGIDPGDGVTGLDELTSSDSMVKIEINVSDAGKELSPTEKARQRTSSMMGAFLEKIEFPPGEKLTPELVVWQQDLAAEISRLENDTFLIPFQVNGQDTLAGIFAQHRVELEKVYTSRVNPLELFFQQEVEEEEE
jgi:hypothetical protein